MPDKLTREELLEVIRFFVSESKFSSKGEDTFGNLIRNGVYEALAKDGEEFPGDKGLCDLADELDDWREWIDYTQKRKEKYNGEGNG